MSFPVKITDKEFKHKAGEIIVTVVGMGEYAISNSILDKIKTFSTVSSIVVTAYSPLKQIAAMIHIARPAPSCRSELKKRPAFYAATGIPLMIGRLCSEYGCGKDELKIEIYGGAEPENNDLCNIGKMNIEAAFEALSSLNLKIYKAETGGNVCRAIEVDVATGEVVVSTQELRSLY